MRKQTRRGLSLVESLLSITLFSALTLSGVQLWSYSTERSLRDATLSQLTLQANQLLDVISADVRQAVFCEARTIGPNPALLVALPELGTDRTGDGSLDDFMPTVSTPEAAARTRPALFRWYGQANDSWDMTGARRWVTRSVSARDRWSASLGHDSAFAVQRLSATRQAPRWRLIESLSFTVNSAERRVTISVVASARNRDRGERHTSDAAGPHISRVTVTRSVNWENGF